jgi:hypothetical protein
VGLFNFGSFSRINLGVFVFHFETGLFLGKLKVHCYEERKK